MAFLSVCHSGLLLFINLNCRIMTIYSVARTCWWGQLYVIILSMTFLRKIPGLFFSHNWSFPHISLSFFELFSVKELQEILLHGYYTCMHVRNYKWARDLRRMHQGWDMCILKSRRLTSTYHYWALRIYVLREKGSHKIKLLFASSFSYHTSEVFWLDLNMWIYLRTTAFYDC